MPRARLPLPKGVPRTLRFQSVAFDVAALADGRLAFAYYDGSRRVVVKRRTLDELRDEAERIALAILNAETAALDLTAEDRRIYIAARDALAPTGLRLDALARDAAEAVKIVRDATYTELARFFAKRNPTRTKIPATTLIVAELLADLADKQRSAKYLAGLRRDLTRFAAVVPDLAEAAPDDIRKYLRELRDPRGQLVGARRRNNVRDAILLLFHFARDDRRYLDEDRKTAADRIERLDHSTDITTYTPAEISLLLEHVSRRWLPWLVIAAFAGLRTSEIFRLDWSAVKWEQMCIAVSRRVAKKIRISRRAPMTPELLACLAPWRDAVGPIYPHRRWTTLERAHAHELERLKKKTGLVWENNALRHSFGSYRLAIVKNEAQVALEMGNSVAKIRENYHDPKSEEEAERYFAAPRRGDNIIPLPLEFCA